MEPRDFDALTRRLASRASRRGVLAGLAAVVLGAFGTRGDAAAQPTLAACGNVICRSNPGKCANGCVCCVAPNGNSRCAPPGQCSWGRQICPPERPYVDRLRGCVGCRTAADCPPSGDACRVATCAGGTCGLAPGNRGGSCGDANACNGEGACDGAGNCVQSVPPVACGPCQACNPASGICAPDPTQEGATCAGTGDKCFGAFQCDAQGACVGVQPTVCTSSDPCRDPGTCDPATGQCSNPVRGNGATCIHANKCLQGGICVEGVCQSPFPVSCPDRFDVVCRSRTGSCNEATGQCEYPPFAAGTRCDSAETYPCTTSTCDGNGTCERGPSTCNAECQACIGLENRCVDIPAGQRKLCDQNRGYCSGGVCDYPCGEDCKDACYNREDAAGSPQAPICCKNHLDANGNCCWRYDQFGNVTGGVCTPSYLPCCDDPECCEPTNSCFCSFGRISSCC